VKKTYAGNVKKSSMRMRMVGAEVVILVAEGMVDAMGKAFKIAMLVQLIIILMRKIIAYHVMGIKIAKIAVMVITTL